MYDNSCKFGKKNLLLISKPDKNRDRMGFFNFSGKSERGENEQVAPEVNSEPNGYTRREDNGADEVFSVPVKAGKRIYYFDVKATRADDYYVTITESRKRPMRDGSFAIDKHKLHLYKEDFAKFAEGFEQVIAYVREHKPDFFEGEARGELTDYSSEQQEA